LEKLKACALGCKVSIIEYVDEYIQVMSERGACQKVADLINKYAEAELYSAENIRHYYRYTKGLKKVGQSDPPPWTGQYESYTPQELWIARESLRAQGKRSDLTSGKNTRSWEQYCIEIGITKRSANNWLNMWFPEQLNLEDKPIIEKIFTTNNVGLLKKNGKI
jgi:hypothetical protein